MNVSPAKIEANRKNALRSTGPKSIEGKNRSRRNALKHGLCASAVLVEDLELVQQRSLEWFLAIKPQDQAQAWLVNRVAVASLGIDRAERIERRVRDKKALKAELCWDDDRSREVKRLGARLGGQPELVVEELRRTPQGCEWLIGRWAMLARAADAHEGSWTPDQVTLAFDLLGTPHQFREGHRPGESIDLDGRLLDAGDDPAAVARREVDGLKRRLDVVDELDEVNQALAMADLDDENDAELKRARRYEAALYRRLRWCLEQVHFKSPDHKHADGRLAPGWVADPVEQAEAPPPPKKTADEVAAEYWTPGRISPPFDLEPDEYPPPGQVADVPAILASRKQKRLAKVESRRDAKRRKVERLRA